MKPKTRFSTPHYNMGTQVEHSTLGQGLVVQIIGEKETEFGKDIEYIVVWDNDDYSSEFHKNLKKIEVDNDKKIEVADSNGT